jgi:hypothetical protein
MEIVALYHSPSAARRAVQALQALRYPEGAVRVYTRYRSGSTRWPQSRSTREGAAVGVVVGATVGILAGLIVGVGALVLPGLGVVIDVGPFVAMPLASAVGALVGALAGALVGQAMPAAPPECYLEAVRRGISVVVVHPPAGRDDEVLQLLQRYVPMDIEQRTTLSVRSVGRG